MLMGLKTHYFCSLPTEIMADPLEFCLCLNKIGCYLSGDELMKECHIVVFSTEESVHHPACYFLRTCCMLRVKFSQAGFKDHFSSTDC